MDNAQDNPIDDFEALLEDDFSAINCVNSLIHVTNDIEEFPIELGPATKKVHFDIQEVNHRISTAASSSALPILHHIHDQDIALKEIFRVIHSNVHQLVQAYQTLQQQYSSQYTQAVTLQTNLTNVCSVLKLLRQIITCTILASRSLESTLALSANHTLIANPDLPFTANLFHGARCLAQLFDLLSSNQQPLCRISFIHRLQSDLLPSLYDTLIHFAKRLLCETIFAKSASTNLSSLSSPPSPLSNVYRALAVLPHFKDSAKTLINPTISPLIITLNDYLQHTIQTAANSLTKSLLDLQSLNTCLSEIVTKCHCVSILQNTLSKTSLGVSIVKSSLPPPASPTATPFSSSNESPSDPFKNNLLSPFLTFLDTPSLPAYFWRTLAEVLVPQVRAVVARSSSIARNLRANHEYISHCLRECVKRSMELSSTDTEISSSNSMKWQREASVIISAIVGPLEK